MAMKACNIYWGDSKIIFSFNIFNKRKGAGQPSQRLPDFIKRIEDALYRNARSMVSWY